jgi:hypothetical protein
MNTIKEVEQYAAQHGLHLSKQDRALIAADQQAERERLAALMPNKEPGITDRFNTFYPKLLQFIIGLGETVLTFAQTVIVSLGVPVVLVLLLVVEHQRVVHGIQLFEIDFNLASSAALALVISNLVLEFQIHHIEQMHGYKEDTGRRWSLRIWARNALYKAGISEQYIGMSDNAWQEQLMSPAQRSKQLLRLVTFTILSLALVGSMKTAMSTYETLAWNEALIAIATKSNMTQLMTWISGLLSSLAFVLTAQGLSRYVAIRCVEIIAAMHQNQQAAAIDPLEAAVEETGASTGYALVNAKLQKMADKKAARAAAAPQEEATATAPDMSPLDLTGGDPLFGLLHKTANGHGLNVIESLHNGNGNGSHHNGTN